MMPLLASSVRNRLALGLASATIFVGVAGTLFRGGSPSKTRHETEVGRLKETAPPPASSPPSRTEVSNSTPAPRQDVQESGSELALFAALEQLERQMSAGMVRARDSVVALEYTALEGPRGARRLATGVVINSRGDVLSVRIDPPSPSASSTPVTGTQVRAATLAAIVAHDASGKRHRVQWVASDPETGLTLLQIAPRAVRPIQIATEEPGLGNQVFIVGNPFGLGHSVSRGHIAGLDRALKLGSRQLGGLIQVQAPLYPGDSGAVVANLRGQLLGLIRSGLAIPTTANDRTKRDNDFGFALPVRDVLWVADQLRAHGYVDRAYLGVRLEPVAATVRQQPEFDSQPAPDGDSPPEGAVLVEVMAGTPAAKGGLRAGDTVIAVDGQLVSSPHDLTDRLDRLPAQSTIRLEIVRGRGSQRRQMNLALQTSSRTEAGSQANLSPTERPAEDQPALTKTPQPDPAAGLAAFAPWPSSSDPAPSASPRADQAVAVSHAPTAPSVTISTPATQAASAEPPPDDSRNGNGRTETQPWRGAPAAVSIPGPARSPLRAAVPPPQPEELKLTLPRAVVERIEQLERRLEKLERVPAPTTSQETRQASSAHNP